MVGGRKEAWIVVKELEQVCWGSPCAWDGYDDAGRPFYVRYRDGTIALWQGEIGESKRSIGDGAPAFEKRVGSGARTAIGWSEVEHHVGHLLGGVGH